MNWEKIITNRFYGQSKDHGKYLGFFSMIGMGVGCFAIIISISVMNGFETFVHKKLKGFEGDIRIYDDKKDGEWKKYKGIESIMPFMERKAVLERPVLRNRPGSPPPHALENPFPFSETP